MSGRNPRHLGFSELPHGNKNRGLDEGMMETVVNAGREGEEDSVRPYKEFVF